MSIDAAIAMLVSKGELEFVSPVLPRTAVVRDVFASRDVMRLIGDTGGLSAKMERVGGKARAKIDDITAGKAFVFGMNPTQKSVTCLVARNAPVQSGVLDVRITDPQPAVRVFGCAVRRDAVVLLTFALRRGLRFGSEVRKCRAEWHRLFPHHHPFIGQNPDEYFSNVLPG